MNRAGLSRALRSAVVVAAVAAYPFLLVTGLGHASPRTIAFVVLALAIPAARLAGGNAGKNAEGTAGGTSSALLPLLLRRFGLLAVVASVAAATNHPFALTLLPSLTNLWLLATFGATLRRGPSMIEQFATGMHDDLPEFLLPYCRNVTVVWCAFFACNALVAGVLAVAAPPRVWAWYTGVLSYVLIAVLAVGEYAYRKSRFRFYESGWIDGLWRRLFPPQHTVLGRRTQQWQLARARIAEAGNP